MLPTTGPHLMQQAKFNSLLLLCYFKRLMLERKLSKYKCLSCGPLQPRHYSTITTLQDLKGKLSYIEATVSCATCRLLPSSA